MTISAQKLVQRVRVALGLSEGSQQIWPGHHPEIVTIDDIIISVLTRAVDITHSNAELWRLNDIKLPFIDNGVYWTDTRPSHYSGHVLLPDNYMRLVYFKMSDWQIPVYSITEPDTPDHMLAYSGDYALGGNTQRPLCLLTLRAEGRAIEFHSCHSSQATIEHAYYVPYAHIDHSGALTVARACIDQVISTAAQLTREIINTPIK